jgi:hypothetical protein
MASNAFGCSFAVNKTVFAMKLVFLQYMFEETKFVFFAIVEET